MNVSIIEYNSAYSAVFKQLNLDWLDKYGLTEPGDLLMLDHPEEVIIDSGGALYLAKAETAIIGSAALINKGKGVFELAKMSVADHYKGKGISKLLIEKCLETANRLGARKIYLQSNSQLTTALALYKKYGFKEVPLVNADYSTADVMMEKELQPDSGYASGPSH